MRTFRLPSRLALLAFAVSAFAQDEPAKPATPPPATPSSANPPLATPPPAGGSTPSRSSEDFSAYARKLRQQALERIEPRQSVPTISRPKALGVYQWRQDILTTTFWVGSKLTGKKGADNDASCWDPRWAKSFGGYDDPKQSARIAVKDDYRPRAFEPSQNPFYFALPYNDVTRRGTKPEARTAIPWFREQFTDAHAIVVADQLRAGLDILTTGDYHLDEDVAGRSWHHYPLQRWKGLEHEELQTEKTRSPLL